MNSLFYSKIPLALKRESKKDEKSSMFDLFKWCKKDSNKSDSEGKKGNNDDGKTAKNDDGKTAKNGDGKIAKFLKNIVLVLVKPWWNLFILVSLIVKNKIVYVYLYVLT